ncbi:MAG: Hsp20/alpha crystallin family protein [Moorellales bacterium]
MYHIQVAWPYFSTAVMPAALPGSAPAVVPRVDLLESDREVVVVVEAPGSRAERFAVDVADQQLEVSGTVGAGLLEGETDLVYRYRERSDGNFRRLISLPARVDGGSASASYRDGLLVIRLPKAGRSGSESRRVNVS